MKIVDLLYNNMVELDLAEFINLHIENKWDVVIT